MPWQPNIAANGELLPGKAGRSGLKLPPGYVLPANHDLEPRPAESSIDTTHIYTLPELIDIAQSSNPSTRRAWNAARDAALAVGIARTAYVPHLTASIVGGYGTRHDNNAFNLENGGLAGSLINNTNTPRTQNNGHGEVQTLNMEWLLFDFGKREAMIDAASQLQLASNVLFTAAPPEGHLRCYTGLLYACRSRSPRQTGGAVTPQCPQRSGRSRSTSASGTRDYCGCRPDPADDRTDRTPSGSGPEWN
jgi:hypothetical protein